MTNCTQCKKEFEITDGHREFYQKMNVPEPSFCPDCRQQRRLSFRNERTFYRDTCSKCHKAIVSQFSPAAGLIVYCDSCYWSDDWAGQDYGRDFDFTRNFGEQFDALNRAVPHMAMIHTNSENCEYTHLAANNKNCYMLIESSNNEKCIHSYWMQKCVDCVDTSYSDESQLIYDSDGLVECYGLFYSRNCAKCTDSYFLRNCKNCLNCYGCVNLSNKEYCIFNEQKTKEEYHSFVASKKLDTYSGVMDAHEEWNLFELAQPRKYAELSKCEQSTGNYLRNVKNCTHIFHGYDAENCTYGEHVWRNARDCMDVSTVGIDAQLVYDALNTALGAYMMRFTNQCWNSSAYVDYSFYCGGLQNGFGCIAVKKGEYCILNKRYSQEEFSAMKDKIIEHMKRTGEWGHFLDSRLSPFGYNESIAHEQFPLTKEEALQTGFNWNDSLPGTYGKETLLSTDIPDSIHDVPDDITKKILACIECGKNYNIVTQELAFYRARQISLPRICANCRHGHRIKQRGPNTLWHRQCMCGKAGHEHADRCTEQFETTYAPDRQEVVYCETCYQEEIL